jgi:hypothetical protein
MEFTLRIYLKLYPITLLGLENQGMFWKFSQVCHTIYSTTVKRLSICFTFSPSQNVDWDTRKMESTLMYDMENILLPHIFIPLIPIQSGISNSMSRLACKPYPMNNIHKQASPSPPETRTACTVIYCITKIQATY